MIFATFVQDPSIQPFLGQDDLVEQTKGYLIAVTFLYEGSTTLQEISLPPERW